MSEPIRTQPPAKERLPNDQALSLVFGVIAVVLAAYLVIRTMSG
jgi:hypothetical protein